MSYFSPIYFALFLPIVALLYSVVPKKAKPYILLVASYTFFCMLSGKLLIYLLFSTLSIHHFGLWLDKIQTEKSTAVKLVSKEERKPLKKKYDNRQNGVLALAVIIHIGILLVLKYSPFFAVNINSLLELLNVDFRMAKPHFAIPIGISFYTLQGISYMTDVRRKVIKADTSLPRLALFMGFFPQIMEGPIVRYNDTAISLFEGKKIEYKNFVFGVERIAYGMLKKIVVADRLNEFVASVFNGYEKYDGGMIAVVAIAYTCQLYMDFSGAMDVVIGSAEIFGIKLPENFRQPFFSKSISEFWSRWHITLGTWFKDYIFYPLSLSKGLKKVTAFGRKHFGNHFGPLLAGSVALFCVWLCNGLWHGSAWMYIFFGMYHFALILSANICEPIFSKIADTLHIDRNHGPYIIFRILKTSVLVVIGELFFRAHGLAAGLKMFKKIFTDFTLSGIASGQIEKAGLDICDIAVVAVVVLIVFIIGILREKGIAVREELSKKNIAIRWAVLIALIFAVIIFGAYGPGYTPVEPMYADF